MELGEIATSQYDADRAPGRVRRWALVLGLAVLTGAWMGPLPGWAPTAFVAHMTMHVSVVAVAAPLLAVAMAGSLLDPTRRWPLWFAPLPASLAELVVIWAWHTPGLHDAARSDGSALAAEQLTFLAAAFWVWMSALGGDVRNRGSRSAAGIGGLLMTSMHMTLLGALLAVAPRPLYDHAHAPMFGLTLLSDQHWGGIIMLFGGGVSYLLGGLYLLWRLLRSPAPADRPA